MPHLDPRDQRCQVGVVLDQPPKAVHIVFSEPIQLIGRGIRVLSPSGRPVQLNKPTAEATQASVNVDASAPGTYIVEWQVISADTHPTRGRFAFSVGSPSSPAAGTVSDVGQVAALGLALQALSRWLHFAGYALAFGTVGALLLARLSPGWPLNSHDVWRLSNTGIVLLLAAEPLALLGQTGSLGVDQLLDGDAIGDALASPFGRLLGLRLAAALLLWVISGNLRSPKYEPPQLALGSADKEEHGEGATATVAIPQPRPLASGDQLFIGTAVVLGLALAVVDSLSQHAASFRPEWLGLVVHSLHLAAMALWLGGLAAVLAAGHDGKSVAKATKMVTLPLILVLLSGAAMALAHVPNPGSLLSTTYGQALAGKQLLLVGACIAAWLAIRHHGARRRLWLGELGVLTLVIGAAALLVSLPPPR